ncbi:deleted in lung and esophageal cancer protein 1-like [Styela clava]
MILLIEKRIGKNRQSLSFINFFESIWSSLSITMDIVSPDKGEVMPPGTPKLITPEPSVHEPSMFYPRPSSERAQDVSHILASTFQDLYTRDVLGKDIVRNLTTSSDGSSKFHQKCTKQLKEAHEEHKRRLEQYAMLEQHIIQARARATSADERALLHAANDSTPQIYRDLGLPPVKSNFRWCLDEDMFRKHNLIVPSDLLPKPKSLVDGPKPTSQPHFAIQTLSSSMHLLRGPVDDGYTSKEELLAVEELQLKDEEQTQTTLSTSSDVLTSSPPRTLIRAHKKSKNNDGREKRDKLHEDMNHDQRVIDRADLARMEERHNFLKNPRYLPLTVPKASKLLVKEQPKQLVIRSGRAVMEETITKEPVQIFMSKPNVVLFSEWRVGRVYEAVLELKNISTVCRQLRVIPPTTSFFSFGLGKYPGVHGLVAPGMSAQFNVRFMPDSLANYEDYVLVQSQSEEPLTVLLKAERKAPFLTISQNLRCGQCLVGGTKVEEIIVKNRGGNGRFCILKKESWPAANFKTVVSPGSLDVGVFRIQPAVFELLSGQTMVLELVFSPVDTENYKENLVIVCDNCQVQDLTIDGEGQAAAVELVSVSDGGEDSPKLGEISDVTADHLIRFPPLNPHSFYMKQLLVHNSINVEMPYTWHILKPNLQTSLRPDEQNLINHFEFYPDEAPAYFIEPQRGTLQPNGIHEFVVTFAPHIVGNYQNVLHLVLSNIPESSASQQNQARKDNLHNVAQESIPSQHAGRKYPLPSNLTTHSKSSSTNEIPRKDSPTKLSNNLTNATNIAVKSNQNQFREVIAMEIELKGDSIPYSVLVHPPAIIVPGSMLEGTTVKRPFKMANYSLAPVQYRWTSQSQPDILEVEPPMGMIDPGDYTELEVSITGSKPGPLSCDLQCKIDHLDQPIHLNIQANIDGPKVVIMNPMVDFGLVRLGDTVVRKVTFRNTTQLPAIWEFSESEHFFKAAGLEKSELDITPDFGELSPLGKVDVKITYTPTKTQQLSTVLDLDIKDGKSSNLAVTADVQTPKACFLECEVICKNAFLSVPQVQNAFLLNQTSLSAKFKFGKLLGKQAENCMVTIHPSEGILAPREKLEIQITFASHIEGEISSLVVPCYVEGMNKPIVMGFYANVKPLSVVYSTPDSECEELKVKFKDPVPIGSVARRKLTIENTTAIRAPWSVSVKNFAAKPPVPPTSKFDFKSANTRRMMLGRTPNLADPMAKTKKQAYKDHCNLMLSAGHGAAFVVLPSFGFLEPFQTQVIEIECYSNMWGKYLDVVECDIEGLPLKHIPLELDVTGCPLQFQVVAGQENKMAVVRFGTHINDGPQVQRKVKVNNTSPVDIRVDWCVLNTAELDDRKLLDLNVWYGSAFPRRDSDGNEITPQQYEPKQSAEIRHTNEMYYNDSPESGLTERSNLTEGSSLSYDIQPKVVNVRLEEHHGKISNIPFSIQPSQCVVPAYGHVVVSAVFSPTLGLFNKTNSKEYISYAHGYMSIDNTKSKDIPEKLMRTDGYSVLPLKLQLTALVKTGSIRIEPDEEEDEELEGECGIQFKIPISDMLILKSRVASEAVQYRHCTLMNDTEMPIDFKLSITRPFFLSSTKPTTDKNGDRITKELRIEASARNRLRPQENLRVKIGFKLSSILLEALDSLRNEDIVPGVELEKDSDTGSESMLFNDELEINFSSGARQVMSVRSRVYIPSLKLSHKELNFGTCYVGQEKCIQIKIENIGRSDSIWNTLLEVGGRTINSNCFRMEPSNGFLEGQLTHLSRNKMMLSIYFVAKCDQECTGVFILRGLLGEYMQRILVTGVGSYDGKYDIS